MSVRKLSVNNCRREHVAARKPVSARNMGQQEKRVRKRSKRSVAERSSRNCATVSARGVSVDNM
eukprot:10254280-Lingulodinium_polyedra.AAC.1